MSRVGKQPITIPSGVKAMVAEGLVNIEGPRGKLSFKPNFGIEAKVLDGQLIVSNQRPNDKQSKASFGSARAHLNNMVVGVTKGWKKSLEMVGVGFGAKLTGQSLVLSVGFSHDVTIVLPKEVKCVVNKLIIDLESNDRQLLGIYADKIRKVQPPEPYLGKGIKYSDEVVRRKAGKTGKK